MKKTIFLAKSLLFGCMIYSLPGYAGTVKKIDKSKKMLVVELDPSESVEKKSKMCVFAEDGKKIGCGTVKKVKKNKATLSFKSAKKLEQVKEGMQVVPKGAGSSTSIAGDGSKGSSTAGASKKVIGFISFGLLTPASYEKIIYEPKNQPTSLWDSGGSSNTIGDAPYRLGFGLQFAFPVKSFSINPGFRFRTFRNFVGEANYAPPASNPYVESTIEANEIGIFGDFQLFRKPLSPKIAFDGGAGLDLAISSVNFKAKKKDDSGKTAESDLASAQSKLNVISLRLNGGIDINFTPKFGLTSGAVIFLPLFATGGQPAGKFADNEAKGVPDPGLDIKEKLAHKKSSLGAEIKMGAFVSF